MIRMTKTLIAAALAALALLSAGTAQADSHSWSYRKGQRLHYDALIWMDRGYSAPDACIQAVGGAVMNKDPDTSRSDWNQTDALYGCLNAL